MKSNVKYLFLLIIAVITVSCNNKINDGQIHVTNVTLNAQSMTISVGESITLIASVSPRNATNPYVIWSTNDISIASVESGVVTGIKAGNCIITVRSDDGGLTASCNVTVKTETTPEKPGDDPDKPATPTSGGVDLGLSVNWATCNVGASKPEEMGGYYAWGETETKTAYDWTTYKWCNGSEDSLTKYCTDDDYGQVDNLTLIKSEDDAANVSWGSNWRIPTSGEWQELFNNCTCNDTVENGVDGFRLTSTKSGFTDKSIFLPFNGFYRSGAVVDYQNDIYYWSSNLYLKSNRGIEICYYSDMGTRGEIYRCNGLGIRPVCEK